MYTVYIKWVLMYRFTHIVPVIWPLCNFQWYFVLYTSQICVHILEHPIVFTVVEFVDM